MQTGTLQYSDEITFSGGMSVRFDVGNGVELGLAYQQHFGQVYLERRLIRFCPGCDVNPDVAPTQTVSGQSNILSMSTRYTF